MSSSNDADVPILMKEISVCVTSIVRLTYVERLGIEDPTCESYSALSAPSQVPFPLIASVCFQFSIESVEAL